MPRAGAGGGGAVIIGIILLAGEETASEQVNTHPSRRRGSELQCRWRPRPALSVALRAPHFTSLPAHCHPG